MKRITTKKENTSVVPSVYRSCTHDLLLSLLVVHLTAHVDMSLVCDLLSGNPVVVVVVVVRCLAGDLPERYLRG